jgi:hypothetical protein
MTGSRPLARTKGLVTEEVEGELLIFDEKHNVATQLNETAALMWRSCDGERTLSDLQEVLTEAHGIAADEDMVLMALDDLVEHGLIESGYEPRDQGAVELTRRRFFRRAGAVGALALVAPVAYSLAVPPPQAKAAGGSA